jgi:hypothetical protein
LESNFSTKMSKFPLLVYCAIVFRELEQDGRQPLKCIWRGASGLLKLSRMRTLTRTIPLKDCSMRGRRFERGRYPVFYVKPHLVHFVHFLSFVPLYNETSPARNAVLYILCRLFPMAWRQMYASVFGGEMPDSDCWLSVDQYTQSMQEPDWYELCEMADLFVCYMGPGSKDERVQTEEKFVPAKVLVLRAFGVVAEKRKKLLVYQTSAFATVLRSALTDARILEMIDGMRTIGVSTDREVQELQTMLTTASIPTLPTVYLIMRQFKVSSIS